MTEQRHIDDTTEGASTRTRDPILIAPRYETPWKRLDPRAELPTYTHEGDSGFDFRALDPGVIRWGEITVVPTGLAVELPKCLLPVPPPAMMYWYTELQIRSRGGMSRREGIVPVTGTCDFGYRGEILLVLTRLIQGEYHFEAGERLVQGVIVPVLSKKDLEFGWGVTLSETSRGDGHFGSTGVR